MKWATGILKTATIRAKFLCYVSLLTLATKAFSQDMLTATLANQQVHDFQRERIRSEYEQEKARSNESNPKIPHHRNPRIATDRNALNFSFRTDNGIVQRVEKKIIANLKSKNPVSGKNLQEALARDKPYPKYLALFKKLGLDGDTDYAAVFTAYMLGMWRIANCIDGNPTTAEIQAVRRQVISNVNISGLSSQQRQEKAAYLIYDLVFANEPYEASRHAKDFRQLKSDSDEVNNRFIKENRMDLRNMEITENGLTNKK